MKKEQGLGWIGIIIAICFIVVVIVALTNYLKKYQNESKDNDIKSNMLLIQGAGKVLNDSSLVNKDESILIGTKLSKYSIEEEKKEQENENEEEKSEENKEEEKKEEKEELIEDATITEFCKLNIIPKEEYQDYYVLTDENLEQLKLNVKNEENSYYLINYKTNEVIITKGQNGKYKISEMKNN